jgi:hypothetical protein
MTYQPHHSEDAALKPVATTDREQQEAKSNLVHSTRSEVQGPKSEAFTPGPWFVVDDERPGMAWNRHIHSDANNAVCFMAHSDGAAPARDAANARLIAAAPMMYAALEVFKHAMESGAVDDDLEGAYRFASAALSRALGEQQ